MTTTFSFFFSISCFEEERRLDIDEKPLVVQLNWNKDDREGRFVLKNENDAIPAKVGAVPVSDASCSPGLGQWNGQGLCSAIGASLFFFPYSPLPPKTPLGNSLFYLFHLLVHLATYCSKKKNSICF